MLSTRRYINFIWFFGYISHIILGIVITIVTLYFSFKALSELHWLQLVITQHTIIALLAFIFAIILSITGVTTLFISYF